MDKLLFIYTNNLKSVSGGTDITRRALSEFKKKYEVIEYFTYKRTNKLKIFFYSLFHLLKCSFSDFLLLETIIKKKEVKIIYFDDSVNGTLIKFIKNKFPNTYIIANFHNDEIQYYHDLYICKGIFYYSLFRASVINQDRCISFSDYRIYITEDDKNHINPMDRNFSIIPATLKDDYTDISIKTNEQYFLFFGSSFFANIEAAKFIIKEIAPFVSEKIVIAGKDMDLTFNNCNLPKNVQVLGFVDNLDKLFFSAKAFLCPIFNGSGMKVKIVEALMHGKSIICTDFAAIGYEKNKDVFEIANNADEFIKKIKTFKGSDFNETARDLYKAKYDAKKNEYYYKRVIDRIEIAINNEN